MNLRRKEDVEKTSFKQLSLFSDLEKEEEDIVLDEKEKKIQKAMLEIKSKYGQNAVLRGKNLLEGGTMRKRNNEIGGHKA